MEGRSIMQPDFQVESRSYDQIVRGSWQAYRLDQNTQVSDEQMADLLHYSEETRIGSLMAMRTITSSIQLSLGLFAIIPHLLRQTDFHLAGCQKDEAPRAS